MPKLMMDYNTWKPGFYFSSSEIINRLDRIDTNHVKFLPNGVDTNRFFPSKVDDAFLQKYSIPVGSDIILTLARIIKRKAHDDVIKAIPDILTEFPKAHYVIAGPHRKKDSYLHYLKQLTKERNIAALIKKENSPLLTDLIYFTRAISNILFSGARSK